MRSPMCRSLLYITHDATAARSMPTSFKTGLEDVSLCAVAARLVVGNLPYRRRAYEFATIHIPLNTICPAHSTCPAPVLYT